MKLLLSLLLCSTINFAYAGQDKGNGGDTCEKDFQIIRDDISQWIKSEGSAGLKLEKISKEQYSKKMQSFISTAKISCTNKTLIIGSAEKVCINHLKNKKPVIVCNSSRFSKLTIDEKYVLVHHEYAGLSGFEVNNAEESNYVLSNQLTSFLEEHVIKKLAINPKNTLENKIIEKFLKEANNPSSQVGKMVAAINEEFSDGRNPEGAISLPIEKSSLQLLKLYTENLNTWKYATNNGAQGCIGTSETSTFILSLASYNNVSGAQYMEKYNFMVTAKEIFTVKRKDGKPLEYCDDMMSEDSTIEYIISSKIEVGKFKELNININEEE